MAPAQANAFADHRSIKATPSCKREQGDIETKSGSGEGPAQPAAARRPDRGLGPSATAPARARLRQEPCERPVPPPLLGGADALGPVAPPAGGNQVGRRRRAAAGPGVHVVHPHRLAAAVAAGPAIPVQHGAAQQRVDATLLGVGCFRVPVEEGMRGRRGEAHRHAILSRACTKLDNPSSGVSFGHHAGSDGLHATATRPAGAGGRRGGRSPAGDGAPGGRPALDHAL